jgi:hypothetical protein
MKALKRIIVWVILSIVMQIAVLYYVDKYLFASEGVNSTISTKKVEREKEKKKDVNIFVPEEAKQIALSYDGSYLSYYKDDELKLVDAYTGEESTIELEDKLSVSFYKWAPDRNIILIAAKKEYNNSAKYLFYSYDAERKLKEKLETKEQDETAFVTTKSSSIEDLQLSPLTNMIYVKATLDGGRSNIQSINIMKRISKVNTQSYFIGDIRIIPNDDRIAYEDFTKNRVYVTGKSKAISIEDADKLSLIGVDDNDNIYVGELESDSSSGTLKVKNIYYGTTNEDSDDWKKVSLNEVVNKKDIYVSRDGKIYINDNLKGIVKELSSNKETVYKGIFIQMYDGGVASISDGKLITIELK